jgi:hypothetical protein
MENNVGRYFMMKFLDSEMNGPDFIASQPVHLREMAAEAVSRLREFAAFHALPEANTDAPCGDCGQSDTGQTGEYPCNQCGLPTLHD